MEKTCEFCGALRPAVYCQPDAAFLCLSCDAKVHSANALSGRHIRALVCDSCRVSQAYVRCLDHLMLMCRRCDSQLHEYIPQHRKQIMGSFTGCPSAKHFAALWGLSASQMGQVSSQDDGQFGSESCVSADFGAFNSSRRASGQQHKQVLSNHQHEHEQESCLIKQQILDLEKLQLTEGNNNRSSLPHHQGEYVTSSAMYNTSGKLDGCPGRQSKKHDYLLSNNLIDSPNEELKTERFPSPISQLDQLSCSSSVGDPFWQYKSPVNNSQFWSQNMQDLGVCEDLGTLDDLNIPDVDVTFRNFEDLFTNDLDLTGRTLLEDGDMIFSNIDKGTSIIHKSENSHSKTTTEVSVSKDICFKNKKKAYEHTPQWLSTSVEYSPHMMRSASFSRSRLSAESSGSECIDTGHSGSFVTHELSNSIAEERTYKERKKARLHGKKSQLAPRQARSDMHKRIKDRVGTMEGYESDPMNAAKSY